MFPIFFLFYTESIIYVSRVDGVDKGPTQLFIPVDHQLQSKIVLLFCTLLFAELRRQDCEASFLQVKTEESGQLTQWNKMTQWLFSCSLLVLYGIQDSWLP